MDLDNLTNINELDPNKIHTSLEHFADQCVQGWEEIMKLDIPDNYKEIDNIVCLGMGGSILGAIIAKDLFKEELTIPFNYYSDYSGPAYISEKTLVICISTSGSTEEVLSSYLEAREKSEKLIGITKGKALGEYFKETNKPLYLIEDGELNPSSVPRVAVGFQLGAYFAILSRLGLINLNKEKFKKIIKEVKDAEKKINVEIGIQNNKAKQVAEKLFDKIPVIIASQHLTGTGKSTNNQINESGKNFSCNFQLPDVNHHQLEGMQFPKDNPEDLVYYLIESDLYHERNQRRYDILKKLLDDLGISYVTYKPKSSEKAAQALESFQFGAYMTYYLGLLNEVDPAPNPFVDKFKELLGK